jgi:hypothetical protein
MNKGKFELLSFELKLPLTFEATSRKILVELKLPLVDLVKLLVELLLNSSSTRATIE